MAVKLILVRHGETQVNAKGLMHRQKDPEKLNLKGKNQITKTASKLKEYNISRVYASNEDRANESAQIISKICGVPLIKIDGIEERNWGNYSDYTWPRLNEILSKLTYTQRYEFIPPKGESLIEFEKRLDNAMKTIVKESEGETVAILSHGGSIRVLIGFLLDLPPKERFKYEPENASISIINYENEIFTQEKLLDTSHLV